MDVFLALILGLVLGIFSVGLYILVSKRNIIRVLMGLEMTVLAAQTMFIVMSMISMGGALDPMIQAILIIFMALAAAVATTFMVLIYLAYKKLGTLDIKKLSKLRW